MLTLSKTFKSHEIKIDAIPMGKDLNISIYGGDSPHIGAVALGIPRESLMDKDKISSSVSILTITGHKEDEIVQKAAKLISSKLNKVVVVCCGIHIDNITLEDLYGLDKCVFQMLNEVIEEFK